jgi:hypothetical protein
VGIKPGNPRALFTLFAACKEHAGKIDGVSDYKPIDSWNTGVEWTRTEDPELLPYPGCKVEHCLEDARYFDPSDAKASKPSLCFDHCRGKVGKAAFVECAPRACRLCFKGTVFPKINETPILGKVGYLYST